MRRIFGGVAGSVAVLTATLLAFCATARLDMDKAATQVASRPTPVLPQRARLVKLKDEKAEESVEAPRDVLDARMCAALLGLLCLGGWTAVRTRAVLQAS